MKNSSSGRYITADNRHPADIKAALEKAGWSLRRLSAYHGLKPESLAKALYHSWPRAERLIAAAIGETPEAIWPERYSENGESYRRLTRKQQSRAASDRAFGDRP